MFYEIEYIDVCNGDIPMKECINVNLIRNFKKDCDILRNPTNKTSYYIIIEYDINSEKCYHYGINQELRDKVYDELKNFNKSYISIGNSQGWNNVPYKGSYTQLCGESPRGL